MKRLVERTAVVTGAASGIGFALAQRCHDEGMNVVMADVESGALRSAAEALGGGDRVLSAVVDVSDCAAMERLAEAVRTRFGSIHLLCNNAGVSITGDVWSHTRDDWEWVINVNFWGVVHGIRAFVPEMVASGDEGHVVNTSSLAALCPFPKAGAYGATKAAVLSLSESLYFDLLQEGTRIGVSVLCPSLVDTSILSSNRNRPADLRETNQQPAHSSQLLAALGPGDSPSYVADLVIRAVREEQFYIVTSDVGRPDIAARLDAIARLTPPPLPSEMAFAPSRAAANER